MNASITFLDVVNITLFTEVNACGIFSMHFIKRTVDKDYNHILNGSLKR